MDLIFIIIFSLMMYLMLESNKADELFRRIHYLDGEVEKEIKSCLNGNMDIDIFKIKEIREEINKKFVSNHKLDGIEIYKESMYKICINLKLGLAEQNLELITTNKRFKLQEISMMYSNIKLI